MTNKKLVEGQEITINIPFTYSIGDMGWYSGKILETLEDCEAEVRAEIDEGNLNSANVMLIIEK